MVHVVCNKHAAFGKFQIILWVAVLAQSTLQWHQAIANQTFGDGASFACCAGGDGEAIQIIKRRAMQLKRDRGFEDFRIVDYSEGIESSTPFTHRYSEGTIQLVRAINDQR